MNVEQLNNIIQPEIKQYFSYTNNSAFMTYLLEENVNAIIVFTNEDYLKNEEFMLYISTILKSIELGVDGDNYIIYGDTSEWIINKNYFGKYFDSVNQLILTKNNQIQETINLEKLYKDWLILQKENK